jgi:hypothetical protein
MICVSKGGLDPLRPLTGSLSRKSAGRTKRAPRHCEACSLRQPVRVSFDLSYHSWMRVSCWATPPPAVSNQL